MAVGKAGALNRIFSKSVIKNLVHEGTSDLYDYIVKKYVKNYYSMNNAEIFNTIYQVLDNDYRNEYYYKNAIFNQILLKKYGVNESNALTELPVGNSKADFILVNGKVNVYEIKTEYDNFDRLAAQIKDYYKAFYYVSVVVNENKVDVLLRFLSITFPKTGVLIMKHNGRLQELRKAKRETLYIDKDCIFKVLRKVEIENILKANGLVIPGVPSYMYYETCRTLFCKLPIKKIQEGFLNCLHSRISHRSDITEIPYSLRGAIYFSGLTKEEYTNLKVFLHKNYGGEQNCISHI